MIQADPTTNSLIITAPGPLYRQLRTVIDKLDGRRAQVLIEALIVEVSADKAAQFGVQWSSVIRNNGACWACSATAPPSAASPTSSARRVPAIWQRHAPDRQPGLGHRQHEGHEPGLHPERQRQHQPAPWST
jgi:general secretion pathway protein D